MKTSLRSLSLSLGAALLIVAGSASATTLSAPKAAPLFTLDVPSGWEDAAASFGQYDIALLRDGQLLYINNILAAGLATEVTAENAKTAVCEIAKDSSFAGSAATCSEPKEMEIAGRPAYSVEASGQLKQEIALFTPDGKTWFIAVAGEKNIGKMDAVLKAIKSNSASRGE